MQVTVPLWMMTWSNTLVYSCECACFVLMYCLVNVFFYVSCVVWCLFSCPIFSCNWCRDWYYIVNVFFYVLYCLMFIVMFHIPMQLMQRLDHWNELYACVRKTRVQVQEHYRLKHEYVQNCSNNVVRYHISEFTYTTINQSMGFASN